MIVIIVTTAAIIMDRIIAVVVANAIDIVLVIGIVIDIGIAIVGVIVTDVVIAVAHSCSPPVCISYTGGLLETRNAFLA